MALAENWHLRSRGRECAALQRPFVAGETIITAIFPDPESSGYLRRDYCLEAWNDLPATADPPFSSWRTSFTIAGADRPQEIEREPPEDLLRRLIEEDEDPTENTRYILAVMLERKKLLRETDTQRTPSGILRIYEHRKTGEVYIVKDPDIPLSQVDAIQQEILLFLESNTRPTASEAQTPEVPGDTPDLTDQPPLTSDL